MPKVILKRGTKKDLEKEPLKDGLLSVTTDDGKMHIDYLNENNEVERKTLYGGKLTFGKYTYDGSEDVNVEVYEGEYNNESKNN